MSRVKEAKATREAIQAIAEQLPRDKFFTFKFIKGKMAKKGVVVNTNANRLIREVLEENKFRRINRRTWMPPSKRKYTRGTATPKKKLKRSGEVKMVNMAQLGESVHTFITTLKEQITRAGDELRTEVEFRKELVKVHNQKVSELEAKIEDLKREKLLAENSSSGKTVKLSDVTTIRRLSNRERRA